MFENSIGAISGILHPLCSWEAEAVNRPPPPLCVTYDATEAILLGSLPFHSSCKTDSVRIARNF
jgi:hypothetical protein